jgi:hypothetical protein
MRNVKEIPLSIGEKSRAPLDDAAVGDALCAELETNGIVVLPSLMSEEQLRGMQTSFAARLRRMRWNNFDGYQQTELYRQMIEDVLLLDQGFVDLAVHPLVKQILNRYLGTNYELAEAKGWRTLPTKRDFHGWHGDAWYDQNSAKEIHREIKLGLYLTDVRSGAFNYIKGSHQRQHPRQVKKEEITATHAAQMLEIAGVAGAAFLFDTSGIHRQAVPVLEPRQAIFLNYHNPDVRLQAEDVDYYRYHPLLLNAAFLGDLSSEDQRILGFGNKTNYQPGFERQGNLPISCRAYSASYAAILHMRRLRAKLARVFSR